VGGVQRIERNFFFALSHMDSQVLVDWHTSAVQHDGLEAGWIENTNNVVTRLMDLAGISKDRTGFRRGVVSARIIPRPRQLLEYGNQYLNGRISSPMSYLLIGVEAFERENDTDIRLFMDNVRNGQTSTLCITSENNQKLVTFTINKTPDAHYSVYITTSQTSFTVMHQALLSYIATALLFRPHPASILQVSIDLLQGRVRERSV
jgi:hypothetical protein